MSSGFSRSAEQDVCIICSSGARSLENYDKVGRDLRPRTKFVARKDAPMLVLSLDNPFSVCFRPGHPLAMRAPLRARDWQRDSCNGPPSMEPNVTDGVSGTPAADQCPEDYASAHGEGLRTADEHSIDDISPYSGVDDG